MTKRQGKKTQVTEVKPLDKKVANDLIAEKQRLKVRTIITVFMLRYKHYVVAFSLFDKDL